jgi:hypothetical protein
VAGDGSGNGTADDGKHKDEEQVETGHWKFRAQIGGIPQSTRENSALHAVCVAQV